jgi:alkylation response protein AidB-like acyl-CoA dehydrogenase
VACAVGNARAALEHSIASVKERSTNYSGAKMRDFQTVQLRIGAAGALIDTALLMMRADCIEGQETANRGLVPDKETKLRYKRNAAFATRLCNEAVDSLHAMAGANGITSLSPWSESSATRTRCRGTSRATSIPRCRRGGWRCWGERSTTPRCSTHA